VTFITWRFFERLRMYSGVQQCGVLFMLVLSAEVVRALVIGLDSNRELVWPVLATALVSTLLWPPIYLILLRIKTAVRVE
ncbi:MAG: hypothetical protein RIC89_12650, partial [Pseudomonadales bacterium]